MLTVNIHEAKTQLSRLIEVAVAGKPFIIAKAGKPLVQVSALSTPTERKIKRLGFMAGQPRVPDYFDRMGQAEIEQLLGITLLTAVPSWRNTRGPCARSDLHDQARGGEARRQRCACTASARFQNIHSGAPRPVASRRLSSSRTGYLTRVSSNCTPAPCRR